MDPITIRYEFRPRRPSLACAEVAGLFGLAGDEPPHTVADGVALGVRPGDVVLFTGPSGSGKSSLLRETGRQLAAVDVAALTLPDVPLVDALAGTLPQRLERLTACGLGEARLMLRTPNELSDGQRMRFRLAYALSPLSRLCGRGEGDSSSATSSPRSSTAPWRRCWRSTSASWRRAPASASSWRRRTTI
jgi:ABC-type ATPase with predicted acetyltransferase domain